MFRAVGATGMQALTFSYEETSLHLSLPGELFALHCLPIDPVNRALWPATETD